MGVPTRAVLLACLSLVLLPAASAQWGAQLSDSLLKSYFSHDQIATYMNELTTKCSRIARSFSIGRSAGGQPLYVLEISDAPGVDEPEPNFKYIGNMHGDEPASRQLLLQLAEWLCANYQTNSIAARIVNDMHLYIIPTMNPDGFAAKKRDNSAGVDLNRNFPDPIKHAGSDLRLTREDTQPEAAALMKFTLNTGFAGAVSFHEGALVANYPWDGYPDGSLRSKGRPAASPDDATFVYLAKSYAAAHATMSQSKAFPFGITNGANWYPVYGGMQDWDYVAAGCFDLTVEISDSKWRPEADLAALWAQNHKALLELPTRMVLGGLQGQVVADDAVSTPLQATVQVVGIDHVTNTSRTWGFYSRPLAPGKYEVTASAPGFLPKTQEATVPDTGRGVRLNFVLRPLDERVLVGPGVGGSGAGLGASITAPDAFGRGVVIGPVAGSGGGGAGGGSAAAVAAAAAAAGRQGGAAGEGAASAGSAQRAVVTMYVLGAHASLVVAVLLLYVFQSGGLAAVARRLRSKPPPRDRTVDV